MSTIVQRFEQASNLQKSGHSAAAKVIYEDIIKEDKNCSDAHHLLGLIYFSEQEIEQALKYITRALEINPDSYLYHSNIGLAYKSLGDYDNAEKHFEEAFSLNPSHLDTLKNYANLNMHFKKWDAAEEQLAKALVIKTDAPTILSLAELYRQRGRNREAIRYYTRYCNKCPNESDVYLKMGLVYNSMGERDNSIWAYSMAIRNNPQSVSAHNNLGAIYLAENKLDDALTNFQNAQHINPEDALSGWSLAKCYFLKGELDKAWLLYHHRWNVFGVHYMTRKLKKPEWCGQELAGKTIFLYNEQGFGDHIQNFRFVSALKTKGAIVVMECHSALRDLFQHNFVGNTLIEYGEEVPEHDFQCSFNALPAHLNVTSTNNAYTTFPYISADVEIVSEWKDILSACAHNFKIGIVWAGSAKHPNDTLRSCDFEVFKPLLDTSHISFINLQVGNASSKFPKSGEHLYDFSENLTDYSQAAALIANLDLVISIDSSIVHLCGAMNTPVWALIAFNPDWQWMLDREDTYWYQSVRLFRQPHVHDWESVICAIQNKLVKLL